jgi:hypothetical protein
MENIKAIRLPFRLPLITKGVTLKRQYQLRKYQRAFGIATYKIVIGVNLPVPPCSLCLCGVYFNFRLS